MTITLTEIVAAIVGQHDGQVFISDATLRTIQPMVLTSERDEARGGYVISLRPAQRDDGGAR